MDQVAPVVPLSREAPVINALTASSLLASYGDSIQLKALAHDPDPGQTAQLTFTWSASCGSVSGSLVLPGTDSTPSIADAVFTAPSTDNACAITATVTDSTGLADTASFVIPVAAANALGSATVTAYLDTYPVMAGLNATPAQLVPGATTTLSVSATDPDGDALTYAWSTPCPGSFSSPGTAATTFTLATSATSTSCDFNVVVTDGNFPDGHPRGGVISNDLILAVKPVVVKAPPIITLDYQTRNTFVAGTVVGMAVAANDPAGGTLTYAWTTTFGPAPTVTTPAALSLDPSQWTSAATFSSPTQPAAHAAVIVAVTATSSVTGLSASEAFLLTAGTPCLCNGTGPGDVPISVVCGQETCASDYTIYSCSAAGWTSTSQSCRGPCQCNGTGPGGTAITVACGQETCGADHTIYSCSAAGWTSTSQSCAPAAPCQCSGAGPCGVAVTVACGQSACGSDYEIYACSASGFTSTGASCGSGGCTCNGTGPGNTSVTVACGQSACGSDYTIYSCSAAGWTSTSQSCAPPCQCSGTAPGGAAITVACGQSTCGSSSMIYACSASGWTLTNQSCDP